MPADNPTSMQFATLTSAFTYITTTPLTSATIVLTPGQQIIDLGGKITIDRPMNITYYFPYFTKIQFYIDRTQLIQPILPFSCF